MTNIEMLENTLPIAPLKLIAMESCKPLGQKVNDYIVSFRENTINEVTESPLYRNYKANNYQVDCSCPRFGSGEAKGILKETIRGTDLFIMTDVCNYSLTYTVNGHLNHMSPDDHYQDLKRIIAAATGKARRINVIMPFLYESRQHKRTRRESLDCALALEELDAMGVSNIITFDAHDPRVCNAIPLMGFDNVVPSYQVLKAMFHDIPHLRTTPDEFMVISPDEGALNRNMYYASMLGVPMGMFYKRRDYSIIVNGRNPIVAHEYLGNSVEGKDVFIADDIISSGESMLDIAYALKKRNARRVFCYATYGLFVNGLQKFDDAYANGYIDAVFGTNLTYRTKELLSREWFHEVDCSKYISFFIAALNHDASIGNVIDSNQKIKALLARRNQEEAE